MDQKTQDILTEAKEKELDSKEAAKKAELAAKKKKEDEIKKIAAIKPTSYYDVKVECMLPATLTYKVLAETPDQAADMIKNLTPNSVKHKLIGRRESKLQVYDAGSTLIKFIKNLIGR